MSMPKNSKTRRFCATYTLFILCVLPFLIFADEKLNCSPGLHDFTDTTLQAPPNFTVTWKTTADSEDNIVIEVIREWSPLGADRFYQLVLDNFFNCATFFRVVPGFVIQFGLAAEPEETAKWDQAIADDEYGVQSNTRGTLSFAMAGPGTRTTQIFVNLNDNPNLDSQGFTPFARVISGFPVWHKIFNPTGESGGASQAELTREGNKWILSQFPDIDLILSTTYVIPSDKDGDDDDPDNETVPATSAQTSGGSETNKQLEIDTSTRNLMVGISALEAVVLFFLICFH